MIFTKRLENANAKRENVSNAVPTETITAASPYEHFVLSKIRHLKIGSFVITMEKSSDLKYIGRSVVNILSEKSPDDTPIMIFT